MIIFPAIDIREGKCVRLLELFGLPGIKNLNQYYKEREKPGEHDIEATLKWQDEMSQIHGKAELIIGKQRHGPIGSVDLSFESQFTRFGNLVKNYQSGSNFK